MTDKKATPGSTRGPGDPPKLKNPDGFGAHVSPQIDAEDDAVEPGRKISQMEQQSSGQGTGQS